MAMIKCKECGKKISDKAKSCPHCGYSYVDDDSILDEDNKKLITKICAVIGIIIVVFIIGKTIYKSSSNNKISEVAGKWSSVKKSKSNSGVSYDYLTLNNNMTCEYSFYYYFERERVLPYSYDCIWEMNGSDITIKDDGGSGDVLMKFEFDKSHNVLYELDKDTLEREKDYHK